VELQILFACMSPNYVRKTSRTDRHTLRSVLGESIWQSSVGGDMPPGVTHEPLLLYLTML